MGVCQVQWVNDQVVVVKERVEGGLIFSAWEKTGGENDKGHDIITTVDGVQVGDIAGRFTPSREDDPTPIDPFDNDFEAWENRNEAWAFIHQAFPFIRERKWHRIETGDIVVLDKEN